MESISREDHVPYGIWNPQRLNAELLKRDDIVRSLWRHRGCRLQGSTNKYNKRSSLSGEFRPARKVERVSDCLEDRPGEIAMAVKMRPSHTWTKRPRGALL